ncbi:unnamed protein product [Diamesa serratosioi]
MAFSSQRNFGVMKYLNNLEESNRLPTTKRSDAAIKSYESCTDSRAWSLDNDRKSQFLYEVIHKKSLGAGAVVNNTEVSELVDGSPRILNKDALRKMSPQQLIDLILALNKEIKVGHKKDIELSKIHNLFKFTSQKLDKMNDIVKTSQNIEDKLNDSKMELQKMQDVSSSQHAMMQGMEKEIAELKMSKKDGLDAGDSSTSRNIDIEFEKLQNRSQMLDDVIKERNILQSQLCKMAGIDVLLKKLKSRSDDADRLEHELKLLKSKNHTNNPANKPTTMQMQQFSSHLDDDDSHRYSEIEAERNFLKQKLKMMDTMEAELIIYKNKYNECERKIMELKEMLCSSEANQKHLIDLEKKLTMAECELQDAERQIEELIETVERKEMEIKEQEIYIESVNRRLKIVQEVDGDLKSLQKEIIETIDASLEPLTDQRAIEFNDDEIRKDLEDEICRLRMEIKKLQVSHSAPTGCCGGSKMHQIIDELINDFPGESITVKRSVLEATKQLLVCFTTENENLKNQSIKVDEAPCSNELEVLRKENSYLDQEVNRLRIQLAEISRIVDEVENERRSNNELQSELAELQNNINNDIREISSSYRSSIIQKEDELKNLSIQLNCEIENTVRLERKHRSVCEELQELRPLKSLKGSVDQLNAKLQLTEMSEIDKMKQLECMCSKNNKLMDENNKFQNDIQSLECKLEEQCRYGKDLAEQLCNRNQKIMESNKTSQDNRSYLRDSIDSMKRSFEEVNNDKVKMIKCYEQELAIINSENESLKCFRDKVLSKRVCQCESVDVDVNEDDMIIRKISKCGFDALEMKELSYLHDKVYCAMVKVRTHSQKEHGSSWDYEKEADKLCCKLEQTKSILDKTKPLVDCDYTSLVRLSDNIPTRMKSSCFETSSNPPLSRQKQVKKTCKTFIARSRSQSPGRNNTRDKPEKPLSISSKNSRGQGNRKKC